MLITWDEDLRTGNAQIDHQHMYLIEQANRFYETVEGNFDQEKIDRMFNNLKRYVGRHFQAEERLMEGLAYPRLSEHHEQHLEFSAKVHDIEQKLLLGEKITATTLKYILRDWLVNHIRRHDYELAQFAKKNRARTIPSI